MAAARRHPAERAQEAGKWGRGKTAWRAGGWRRQCVRSSGSGSSGSGLGAIGTVGPLPAPTWAPLPRACIASKISTALSGCLALAACGPQGMRTGGHWSSAVRACGVYWAGSGLQLQQGRLAAATSLLDQAGERSRPASRRGGAAAELASAVQWGRQHTTLRSDRAILADLGTKWAVLTVWATSPGPQAATDRFRSSTARPRGDTISSPPPPSPKGVNSGWGMKKGGCSKYRGGSPAQSEERGAKVVNWSREDARNAWNCTVGAMQDDCARGSQAPPGAMCRGPVSRRTPHAPCGSMGAGLGRQGTR